MLLITGVGWPELDFTKPIDNKLKENAFTIAGEPIYLKKVEHGIGPLKKEIKEELDFQSSSHTINTCKSVWDGCIVLSKYLEFQTENRELKMEGKRVLELGSGQGIVGISCSFLGSKVVLTDVKEALPQLKYNLLLNPKADKNTEGVLELNWASKECNKRVKEYFSNPFDIIVAADVVWVDELVLPLCQTINEFLIPGKNIMYLCYQPRGKSADQLLFKNLQTFKLIYELIDFQYHHPFYKKPDKVYIYKIIKEL